MKGNFNLLLKKNVTNKTYLETNKKYHVTNKLQKNLEHELRS